MSLLAVVAVMSVAAVVRTRLAAPRSPLPPPASSPRRRCRAVMPGADTDAWATLLGDAAASVRSGASLTSALDDALASTPVRGVVVGAGRAPWDVSHAAGEAHERCGPDERLVVAVLCAAHRVGGRTAPALDGAAAVLRERIARRAEARVHAASARASARLLTFLPLVVAVWSAIDNEAVRAALVSPIGVLVTLLGVALNVLGRWWMHVLVRAAAP